MKVIYAAASSTLQRWFWWLLLLNILFIAGSRFYLQPLDGRDIVRFEVAKTTVAADSIAQGWRQSGKYERAVQSIYIDYLFIILYTTGLAVACAYISRLTGHEILIRAGKGASYLLAAAGICDVIENMAMTRSLVHGPITPWNVALTHDMAAAKFSVIIVCLLFLLVCLVFWLSNKLFGKENSFFL